MGVAVVGALTVLGTDVPVVPDGDEARDWLIDELSKAEYAAAKPSWFDLASQAVLEWLQRLLQPQGFVPLDWLPIAIILVVITAIATAIVIWGRPRRNRRSALAPGLFGDDDRRTAAELRRSAATAAAGGDWTTAVLEQFRAIARALAERTIVMVSPGTTAHAFALRASAVFPGNDEALRLGADDFDTVRYFGTAGTREQYVRLLALDSGLATQTPSRHEKLDEVAL